MQVLASLVADPEDVPRWDHHPVLSLIGGASPPVLIFERNAVYLGDEWTLSLALDFAALRDGMPEPAVYDWDDATVDLVLARSSSDAQAAELDHRRRLR